jgi:type I restriction-modification system DNA methylase subunit
MNKSSQSQFNQLSIDLTKSLSKPIKKAQGIYFTPQSIIERLINSSLSNLSTTTKINILEPSCGSCEMIKSLDDLLTDVSITGIELNAEIYNEISKIPFKNQVALLNSDFMSFNSDSLYDLIIGNPPYFVCKKESIPAKYTQYITGRPNIFGLFIIHSLQLLSPNGILAFVIPKSFLNSAYYANIRNYIKQTCDIIAIEDYEAVNDFIDTDQSTFGLIIKKLEKSKLMIETVNCPYSIMLNNNYIFTSNAQLLASYFENATTIQKMGLAVKTGTIVWNEHKDLLTSDELDTILLYNTNVTNDNKIKLTTFKNAEKAQHIQVEGSTDPIIVVNRGNGNASYNFKYALIEKLMPFVVENHLNMIYSPSPRKKSELIDLYKKIIHSFENPKTRAFIELFFGNNGLSKTELETILPIYL